MWRLVFLFVFLLVGCASHPASHKDLGAQYLGAKYKNSPLGEGTGVDKDPLIRADAFDCTTFVETVLADGDVDKLTKIRYRGGDVGFLTRNHFIETDWLNNNANLVENVSADYGRTAVRKVVIDKSQWLRKVHKIKANYTPEVTLIEYLPYYTVKQEGIKVSEPMVVLFIVGNSKKNDKIGTDLAVAHMGFLMPDGTLRHASSARRSVVDVDFMDYCGRQSKNKKNLGVVLLEIKDE